MVQYGMSMCVLGMAAELQTDRVAVNALWPRTGMFRVKVANVYLRTHHSPLLSYPSVSVFSFLRAGISTAAIEFIAGSDALNSCRVPAIVADAAAYVLAQPSDITGQFFIDDTVLTTLGGMQPHDLERYAVKPGTPLMIDFFLDDSEQPEKSDAKRLRSKL